MSKHLKVYPELMVMLERLKEQRQNLEAQIKGLKARLEAVESNIEL